MDPGLWQTPESITNVISPQKKIDVMEDIDSEPSNVQFPR